MKNDVVEAAIFTVGAESFAMRRNAIVRAMPEWRDANARLREADIQAAAHILATLERREPTRAALLRLTDQSANIDRLYGPAHASDRAAILSALCGRPVPKSRAGWHLFRSAILAAFGVADGHDAWARLMEAATGAVMIPLCETRPGDSIIVNGDWATVTVCEPCGIPENPERWRVCFQATSPKSGQYAAGIACRGSINHLVRRASA